tara:strand:+ start:789 stop:1061 length:273 start_codon:yes stop_codon:yes gene_type:complete
MNHIRYLFNSLEQAEIKVNLFIEQNGKADFIWLDKFTKTSAEFNNEGVETVAATFTASYSLDVFWHDLTDSPYGWKSYEINPKNPKHTIF